MSAWGHEVVAMDAESAAIYKARGWTCIARVRGGRCPEPAEFEVCYLYVTGRKGRVTESVRHVCRAHAEHFAQKYGATIPVAP